MNIDSIQISGSNYDLQDKNASKTVVLTQAEYDALSGQVSANTFYVISDATPIDISTKADASALTAVNDTLTAHTANTSIHVTTAQTATWNAKSDFSGSYNDLTNKPTIPTTISAVTSGSTAAVESGAVYEQLDGFKLLQITQSAYDALVSGGTVDNKTIYYIIN